MALQAEELRIPHELAIDDEPFSDDQYEAYERGGSPDNPVAKFAVNSPDLAEWAMAHVAELEAKLEELRYQRAAYLERIESWFERDTQRAQQKREFFAMHLRHYLRELREADPNTTSVTTPSGKITSRASAARVTVANEAEALAYVKGNFDAAVLDEAIRVNEKLLVSGLKNRIVVEEGRAVDAETHNPVPGMGVEPAAVKYDVKAG